MTVQRYWSVPLRKQASLSDEAAVSALESALDTAVSRCMVADVAVGAFLSGGLDSSLIAARLRGKKRTALQTFSAGFGDPGFNELPQARQVSNLLNCASRSDCRFRGLPCTLGKSEWRRDGPISEASDVAVYRLAEMAAQYVKVVLSGEGSDELFAGYPKHRYARLTSAAGIVPYRLRRRLLTGVERTLPAQLTRPRTAARALMERTEPERMEAWFAPFLSWERAALLGGSHDHDRYEVGRRTQCSRSNARCRPNWMAA